MARFLKKLVKILPALSSILMCLTISLSSTLSAANKKEPDQQTTTSSNNKKTKPTTQLKRPSPEKANASPQNKARQANAKQIPKDKDNGKDKDKKKPAGPPPAPAEAMIVTPSSWQASTQTIGSLEAKQGVMISAMVDGQVEHILFQSNQIVRKNDPLVVLYNEPVKQATAKLKATLELKRIQYERAQILVRTDAISKSDYDITRSQYQAALADYRQSLATLEEHTIKAPFDGKLGIRKINLGDYLTAGKAIVDLQNLSTLRVNFAIPQQYLNQIKVGESVGISLSKSTQDCISGIIHSISVSADINNRSVSAQAYAQNQYHWLPGFFVNIRIPLGKPKIVFKVPLVAIVYDIDASYVFVLKNNIATKQPIHIVSQNDTTAFIDKGISNNDMIATSGIQKIRNHGRVILLNKPVKETAKPTSSEGGTCD